MSETSRIFVDSSTFYCQELTILGSLINPCTYARAVELAAR